MPRGGNNGSLTEQFDGSTNPFSDSFIERRLALVSDVNVSERTEPHPDGFVEAAIEKDASCWQDVPINQLSTHNLDPSCRLLLQPANEVDIQVAPETSSARWMTLATLEGHDPVTCLAICQGPAEPSVKISLPIPMEVFFDSQTDAVEIRNRSPDTLLDFRRVDDDDDDDDDGDDGHVPVAPFASDRFSPGAWAVSGFGRAPALQFVLFPRKHRLEIVQQSLGLLQDSAGSKRRFSARIRQQSLTRSGQSQSQLWDVVKPVKSLTEAVGAQTVRITGTDGTDYTIFRMSNAGPSASADVFAARLSQYQGQLVVVKVLKPGPSSAASRALNWAREYRIHERLRSDTIVQLYGGDARIDALFLAHINAKDLAHQSWCERGVFQGTGGDARRILEDMARALAYLRTEKVLHNDIKPRNILYSRSTGATLIDFGLGSSDGDAPSSGGTPWYVPPEFLASGARAAPADVWALGIVMLYLFNKVPLPDSGKEVAAWQIREVATGRTASAECMAQWLRRVEKARRALAADQGIDSIVLQMLQPSPHERIHARELLRQLEELGT
ncbi:kinase-like domain-containing protein [Microdochium trichocladiopsis]|uniref:Kinase-like domain-containing protein n=1 Tax=Microdochium trichocladiopsis TaxID=1682393 RepID=A0A9P8XXC9_9PEZI|nr:kinase-like domain-containing protein [Microdochium trichocladiopsis]KAH7024989.1 kinase-like domain-containing protein [Microdochium trichocladiopsis]